MKKAVNYTTTELVLKIIDMIRLSKRPIHKTEILKFIHDNYSTNYITKRSIYKYVTLSGLITSYYNGYRDLDVYFTYNNSPSNFGKKEDYYEESNNCGFT